MGEPPRDRSLGVEAGSRDDVEENSPDRLFDELVDYGTTARDLDRLASRNPRTAVLGGMAVGFLIGFGAGILATRD